MFNIQKQGSSLLITSSDNTQFPYKDGKMSIPMNSITYVIDESNYIAFRSSANNDILFTANIDDIQINGSTVGKDDFIMMFDSVANSTASGGGGTASAGVNSLNGFQGDLTLKTINGKNIIGSGDITIEGGGSGTAGVNKIILGPEDYGWNTYQGDIKLTAGFSDYGDGILYDVSVAGKDVNGNESGSLWFGFRCTDSSIIMEDGGGRVDMKVNEWTGTQSEYDALGEYDSNCTYYITE